jgi:hypothetical protein
LGLANRRKQMKSRASIRVFAVLVLVVVLLGLPSQVCADPVWTVFRDTIGGSLAGLLVGLAIDVAREGDNGDATRVCFIAGTFAGLGLGIYQAMNESKSEKQSLLRIEPGKTVSLHLTLPEATVQRQVNATGRECTELSYRLRVISVGF